MQLDLRFLEIPVAETKVWGQLDDEQRTAAIETLARVIAQARPTETHEEPQTDD